MYGGKCTYICRSVCNVWASETCLTRRDIPLLPVRKCLPCMFVEWSFHLLTLLYLGLPFLVFSSPLLFKDSDDEQEADYDPEGEASPASDDHLIEEDSDEDYELDKSGEAGGPPAKKQRLEEEPTEDEP